ncbi:hypothetical protein LEMLEM_LOCUS21140 [Lemmus lemmus]
MGASYSPAAVGPAFSSSKELETRCVSTELHTQETFPEGQSLILHFVFLYDGCSFSLLLSYIFPSSLLYHPRQRFLCKKDYLITTSIGPN